MSIRSEMNARSGTRAARLARGAQWALLALLVAATGVETAPLDLAKAYRQQQALVIGINAYARWTPLNYARGDAEAVGKKLEALGFTVDYLLDGQATRERIIERLGALESQVQEDDQIFVYFSGHGDTRKAGTRTLGYLVPVDGDPAQALTGISMETLRELSGVLKARHVMFALDACFSGTLLTEKGPGGVRPKTQAFYQDTLAKRVRFVLTAGTAGQKAVEVDGQGLFTRQLLQALDGAADPKSQDGVLTGLDIATYVRRTVSEIARQRYGKVQTPLFGYMEGQADGEFLFMRRAVTLPPSLPPRPPEPTVAPPPARPPETSAQTFALQLGAKVMEENAETLRRKLDESGFPSTIVRGKAYVTKQIVTVGEPTGKLEAEDLSRRLGVDGFASQLLPIGEKYTPQTGAFFNLDEAIELARELQKKNYSPKITSKPANIVVYQVRHGKFDSRAAALKRGEELKAKGFNFLVVRE